jgi:hypothetical protein
LIGRKSDGAPNALLRVLMRMRLALADAPIDTARSISERRLEGRAWSNWRFRNGTSLNRYLVPLSPRPLQTLKKTLVTDVTGQHSLHINLSTPTIRPAVIIAKRRNLLRRSQSAKVCGD